ncbi:MAG TPA: hypothetical protein VN861_09750 [Candidatus Acidoferrales bacterium]|nr:hypothetical protein [Candidatus Acidoferrales bacterium]
MEQVIMTMAVNFARIDKLRRGCISAFSRGGNVTHYFCQCQELGADLQPGAINRIRIDEKTNTVIFESKLDGTARGCEIVRFTDEQDTVTTELSQYLRQKMALGGRNEKNLATGKVSNMLHADDIYGVLCNHFPSQCTIESSTKRIRPEYAHQERGFRISE